MAIADVLSHYHPRPYEIKAGDFYVAPNGNDDHDGSWEHPFQTLARAVQAVRAVKAEREGVTVCVRAGEYPLRGLHLTSEDSGSETCPIVYRAYGDGEVIFNGGITLKSGDFEPIPPEIRERLHGEARDHVVMIDLTRYGLTADDWGALSTIGAFGTEAKYDSWKPDSNCELFFNGERMTLARYPNDGEYLRLDAVADVGDVWEFPGQNYHFDWNERRNHRGGTYIMDKETTARLKGWQSLKDIWAYGYFCHDWADSSTPIKAFDLEHRTFYPEYVSRYGARKDAIYYFYNVLDELDAPGEWYLDRERGMLYLYPLGPLEDARVEMTITRESIIHAEDVHHLTFEGFTLKGTRADALTLSGEDNLIRSLNVHGVMGDAIVVCGRRNRVTDCEISHTGKGGILLDGGDRTTLTPGNNVADNNHIHHWAEVYMMYHGAVHLNGVGNVCSHNEIHDAPHAAIFYYGNDHLIEYNHIHDVVKHSSDAGAIYSGQDWTCQGCVVRYNCLYNIGEGEFRPDGIYFDDMLSGQSAYGNLLIGVLKYGFLIGGGRDNFIRNNIIIDCGTLITYDDRGRDAFLNNGWAVKSVNNYETSSMWCKLRAVPYQSDIWARKYPSLARISHDFAHPDDPDFAVNPAHGAVQDNLCIKSTGVEKAFLIAPSVKQYSQVERNCVYASYEEAGLDPDTFTLKEGAQALCDMPNFASLPLDQIGRY